MTDISKTYKAALKSYLSGGGERALEDAYTLGRQSLEQGVGIMAIVTAHHEALSAILHSSNGARPDTRKTINKASEFLSECISTYEMTQGGFQETIAALRHLIRGDALGLPGIRRLMSEVQVDSKPGKGTTVTIKKWKS